MSKNFLSRILRVLVVIAAGAAIFWYSTLAGYWIKEHVFDAWRVKKHLAEYQEALEAPAKADIYGSAESPQETFQMFMDALRAEDFYLASRYFVLADQDEWYENLKGIKTKGLLDKFIDTLSKMESEGSGKSFYYYSLDQEGVIEYTINFNQNPVNHRWKISEL